MLWRIKVNVLAALALAVLLGACSAQLDAENLSATARVGRGAATAALADKQCESSSSTETLPPQEQSEQVHLWA